MHHPLKRMLLCFTEKSPEEYVAMQLLHLGGHRALDTTQFLDGVVEVVLVARYNADHQLQIRLKTK